MPPDVPLFSTVEYASVVAQRPGRCVCKRCVPCHHRYSQPINQVVSPRAKSKGHAKTSKVVSFTWLEMAPIFTHTRRKLLIYVPAIDGKVLLPGDIITDDLKATRGKIVSEYKTVAASAS